MYETMSKVSSLEYNEKLYVDDIVMMKNIENIIEE